ncbi:bifunctional diaminohydroxyphosphoribosylaminopyrimidine deaminase/5-amino-6-(5-phosphoribosylamino)uracil reductase RibD [Pedobacter sp. LMG 31464]|uniref:Riboflavin biosynthesis protein RibD n=1 Tax=Pedobacter planticolens TaxID=2679964 RepID=A0A923DVQ8_9SPHI|nr:bifunctional diaminohydroxyphosphoribosylaminopyrimidine deaminase/5-amino-6-(5-phosphoribosylamino)uracil reductase RibD [Pedobacter planticolens]MBB2144829.1 bifunctional diaminohydroxyphosphoribosylaminopyrimidine deaminase/5-amino-6-(5-phosphoribosylamino)uracil reductase RibD [Pedobacter planticolens]
MSDELYIQRCLELAAKGMGNVSPNPMVGCVVVYEGKIIGEGYHQKFGEAHAEVNAINDVFTNFGDEAPSLLKNAIAYVNLEPCAHFGKTPPCADLLVKHQLKKVVIGNTDPFSGVNGKGIEKLKAAGIVVVTGVLVDECSYLNRRFFTRIEQQRPFIILKWAQTANGYFAPKDATQKWISGSEAKQLTHQWRSEEDAIVVGKQTALIDNPQLTARNVEGKNPIRIVIDSNLAIPETHHVYNDEAKTIVFNEIKTDVINNIHFVQMEDMQFYLAQKIAFQLYLMDIQSVIIEGGAQILSQFITANLWDEARIFTSKTEWNDGIKAPSIKGNILETLQIGADELTIYSPYSQK